MPGLLEALERAAQAQPGREVALKDLAATADRVRTAEYTGRVLLSQNLSSLAGLIVSQQP